jgi:hypothetical protein
MMKLFPIFSLVFCFQSQLLPAQAKTAHHRKVYAEINGNVESYKRVTAEEETDHASVELCGWTDGGSSPTHGRELKRAIASIG